MVRYINPIWPFWDLEDTYPQYAEFQLADNILHLIKIICIFYLRAWSVLATNLPSKKIFQASKQS